MLASKHVVVYTVGMDYRAIILSIRSDYLRDKITLEEAKAKVLPLLEEMNAKGKQISKENDMPFKPLTFSYVFR